jgi:hypothetical protein
MKFAILDTRVRGNYSSNKYQYLDELLDKTFVTDYFLDRSVEVVASVAATASATKP